MQRSIPLSGTEKFMQIDQYYSTEGQTIHFTRQQASDFAKQVADDFNPIHDIDAKRFCVPGDLLFAVALSKIGLSQSMHVRFAGMVTEGVKLTFPEKSAEHSEVCDENAKLFLEIESSGLHSNNATLIANLTREYVAFSGHTFPHILVPLWQKNNVMINPDRPLVIYQSMSIELDTLDIEAPSLAIAGVSLSAQGKRGDVSLGFNFIDKGEVVGRGEKRMVLSGLREFDQIQVDGIVEFYNERKLRMAP